MNDLDHHFDQAKQLHVPVLWEEVERRAVLGETHLDTAHAHPLRALVVLAAALAMIGTTLYAIRDLGRGETNTAVPAPGEIERYRLDGPPQPIAAGEGAVWVEIGAYTDSQIGTPLGLMRIDVVTGERRMLDAPGTDWPAVGGGSAWLLCHSSDCDGGSVLKLDPVTGEVDRTIALPGRGLQIVGTASGIWVTTDVGASFIDSGGVLRRTIEGQNFNLIGADENSVWFSAGPGVRGFDVVDGHEIAKVPFGEACNMEVADGMVWVASCDQYLPGQDHNDLMGIDATTGRVLFRTTIEGYGQMRYSNGVLWIAQGGWFDAGFIRLVPLNPSSGLPAGDPIQVERNKERFSIRLSVPPGVFFAIGEGSAWLTDFGAGEVIRVGLPEMRSAPATSAEPALGSIEQAAAGVASYAIRDVSVTHDSPGVVGVVYSASWTTSSYPGPAECELVLLGSSYEQLGTFPFQMDSMSPDFRAPDPLLVPFDGADGVVSASGVCGAGDAPADPETTVTIESPEIVSTDTSDVANRFVLTGVVRWADPTVYAGEQACSAAIVLPDGSTTDYRFTLDLPDGASLQIGLPDELGKGELKSAKCIPFNGADWP